MSLDIHIGFSTNLAPLGSHSDVPITHGPNLTLLESGSDGAILYSLKLLEWYVIAMYPLGTVQTLPKGNARVT